MTSQQGPARWLHTLLSEKGFAAMMIAAGCFFVGAGIRHFWLRPEHFGLVSALGCLAGTAAAFVLLMVTAYVFHHAPLVFLPWFILVVYLAYIQPHFGVGMGVALWLMMVEQLRG